MRRLVYILVVMVVAGAVGCRRGASDIEQRLIDIDSLIADSPDSALTLLGALDTSADLSDRRLAGYHALLTAQAMYKAYIPATSDSIINVAWDYYKDLGLLASAADRRRRVRAMLYKGTTAEELGHPDSAMRWYKRTEDFAQDDDHFIKGYSLMRQAILHQDQYAIHDSTGIQRYKKALYHFSIINELKFQLVCLLDIGCAYRTKNTDSATHYLKQCIELSRDYPDQFYYFTALVSHAGLDLLKGNYRQAVDTALWVLQNAKSCDFNTPEQCRIFLARAYVKLNMPDSAAFWLPKTTDKIKDNELVGYYKALSWISETKHDSLSALRNNYLSLQLADSLLSFSFQKQLQQAEARYDKAKSQYIIVNQRNQNLLLFLVLLVLISLLSGVILYIRYQYINNKEKLITATSQVISLEVKLQEQHLTQEQLKTSLDAIIKEQNNRVKSFNDEITLIKKERDSLLSSSQANEETTKKSVEKLKILDEKLKIKQEEYTQIETELKNLIQSFDDFSYIIGIQFNTITKMSELIAVYDNNPHLLRKKIGNLLNENDNLHNTWLRIRTFIDYRHPGLMNIIIGQCPNLTIHEQHLIMLIIENFTLEAIAVAMGWKDSATVSRKLYNLKIKMQLDKPVIKYIKEKMEDYK